MQNQTPPKQGVRARERNALERIGTLENDLMRIAAAVQNALNETESKYQQLVEVVDAISNQFGPDVIAKAIQETRDQRAEEAATKAKEGLQKAIENVEVVAIDTAEDDSIITGIEYDKEGAVLKPGYVQLAMQAIKPEFQEKIKGKGVGNKFEVATGGTFEVTGVYKAVPKEEKEEEVPAEEAK